MNDPILLVVVVVVGAILYVRIGWAPAPNEKRLDDIEAWIDQHEKGMADRQREFTKLFDAIGGNQRVIDEMRADTRKAVSLGVEALQTLETFHTSLEAAIKRISALGDRVQKLENQEPPKPPKPANATWTAAGELPRILQELPRGWRWLGFGERIRIGDVCCDPQGKPVEVTHDRPAVYMTPSHHPHRRKEKL